MVQNDKLENILYDLLHQDDDYEDRDQSKSIIENNAP